jgi:hypothetical protein
MSENGQEWFVVERARALAWMYLTERDDLVITKVANDVGLDYQVSLREKDGKSSLRQLGIVLRAARKPTTVEELDKTLRPAMKSLQRIGDFPYPVSLFYFTMEDNRGYFTWVAEPIITEDRKPRLRRHAAASCRVLDRSTLDQVIRQVMEWYDAFFSSMVVRV